MTANIAWYALKCVGALFAAFLAMGAVGSLIQGDRPFDENSILISIGMIVAAAVAAMMFWPRWSKS